MTPMTPELIASITALVGVLERVSTLPFGMLLFCMVVGPWILSISLFFAERKRFERVVAMYESNVKLVEAYRCLSQDQREIITLNTQAWIGLKSAIESNQYCPVIREKRITHQSVELHTGHMPGKEG